MHTFKLTLTLTFLCLALLNANVAYSIVSKRQISSASAKASNQITTDIAKRAHSDVQVRKLLNLFASKKVDSNVLYERLREIKSRR